ncbi:MAG: 50S ribosomal protein L9 [Oligoflexia bacterium]|nr:50S ribosomal protein L9 [Oligoflexia bacterium]
MKVILAQDVRSLGKVGDLVRVADGYARNFLVPRKLAMEATEDRVKEFKHLQTMADAKKKKASASAKKVAEKLSGQTVTLRAQAGEQDKLFGSITSGDIANELTKAGFNVERRDIQLDEVIKVLGQYRVKVRIATGVEAEVKVNVEREK